MRAIYYDIIDPAAVEGYIASVYQQVNMVWVSLYAVGTRAAGRFEAKVVDLWALVWTGKILRLFSGCVRSKHSLKKVYRFFGTQTADTSGRLEKGPHLARTDRYILESLLMRI